VKNTPEGEKIKMEMKKLVWKKLESKFEKRVWNMVKSFGLPEDNWSLTLGKDLIQIKFVEVDTAEKVHTRVIMETNFDVVRDIIFDWEGTDEELPKMKDLYNLEVQE